MSEGKGNHRVILVGSHDEETEEFKLWESLQDRYEDREPGVASSSFEPDSDPLKTFVTLSLEERQKTFMVYVYRVPEQKEYIVVCLLK